MLNNETYQQTKIQIDVLILDDRLIADGNTTDSMYNRIGKIIESIKTNYGFDGPITIKIDSSVLDDNDNPLWPVTIQFE